jgi:RND family efflux transporter MFP subunit
VAEGLRTAQDLVEVRNKLETTQVRLKAAEERLARVMMSGQRDGVPVRAPFDAVIAQVSAKNGEAVEAGAPIMRVVDARRVWLHARFIAPTSNDLENATPVAARMPDGTTMDLAAYSPRLLSARPVVNAESQIASWTVELNSNGATAFPAPLGSSAVVVMRVGEAHPVIAVPRTAVLELNTRPYVFVQESGESFEKRAVGLGPNDGGWIQIVSGISRGERVVTRGAFDIHLSSLVGTMESHKH